MVREIDLGDPVEDALWRLADRLDVEELRSLAGTVSLCKRTEGNLAKVMEHTVRQLTEKMDMQEELKVLLARKKLEQKQV